MPLDLELADVSYSHGDAVPLLQNLDFRLQRGWTGVVGANGCGKTTLLRLLAGELEPETGLVRAAPRLRRALCAQRVEPLDPSIRALARSTERAAQRLRGRLGLTSGDLEHWPRLSPGERKRWQVAAALASEPDLLLVDEPTNHLDPAARAQVVAALAQHEGIGVVVSHDRALLAELTAATVRVHAGTATLYRASYAQARETWEAERRGEERRAQALRRERRQLTQRLTRQRARRDHAQARTRTSQRMKGPRDNATAGGLKQTRRRSAVNALGRDIHKLHGRIGRVEREAAGIRVEKTLGRDLFLDYRPCPERELARLDMGALRPAPGARPLLEDVHAVLRRDDRIWISGANGAGKSTLLAALEAALRVPAERVLVMPQEVDVATGGAALDRARALPPDLRGHLLQRVAALGVDPDALLASACPSPGEARKLLLAEALSRQVWALLLDEPTNHLDLPSLEHLEDALAGYPGALLWISHDEHFARPLARTRWHLEGGRPAGRAHRASGGSRFRAGIPPGQRAQPGERFFRWD